MRVSDQDLLIQCRNATEATRVHVFSTRYVAPFDPFDHMRAPAGLQPEEMAATIKRVVQEETGLTISAALPRPNSWPRSPQTWTSRTV